MDDPFDYWAWAKTAPRCEGCGHPFDLENARLTNSPDPQRWCCSTCAKTRWPIRGTDLEAL